MSDAHIHEMSFLMGDKQDMPQLMMMQRMATIVAFPLHHIKTPTMCCRVH
jgi:hypothetical protein